MTATAAPTTDAASSGTAPGSWWFPPIALGRIGALRVLAYAFVPIDVLVTTTWISEHRFVPGRLYRPVLVARLLHLPTPTHAGVLAVRDVLLAAALLGLVLALRGRGAVLRVTGAVVAVSYLWWMLIGQSYGKVDHDRYGFLVMLFALPTVGAARLGSRQTSEATGWAVRMTQIAVVATYCLAAWAKIRFGGWGWMNGATLSRAVLRRGTGFAQWTLHARWFLHGFQWFLVLFEAGSVVLLVLRRQRLVYGIVALLIVFHVTTYLMLRIIFLPHLVALTAFLPLELVGRHVDAAHATGAVPSTG